MATALSTKAHELMTLSKDELVKKGAAMATSLRNIKNKAKAPLKQFAGTASGWAGAAVSGVTHYYIPDVMGVPVDGAVGVLISLGCLMGAGDSLADASAIFGVGLAAPAISRGVENGIRTWAAHSKKAA